MNAPRFDPEPIGIQALASALKACQALDALPLNLSEAQWTLLADYLQPMSVRTGDVVIEQGVKDRVVYLVESGSLTVHYEDAKDRIRIALVGAGSILGEGAFFSQLPRSASVQAGANSRLWCLTPLRFRELSLRTPDIALELTFAMAAVLARRLYNRAKRVAVT
jgi:CRP/FNR family cyclic AMP-dependent transcriptional regulator